MEVTGGFKIVELLKLLGNSHIGFKTLFNFAFSLERLAVHERVLERSEVCRVQFERVASALVQLELFLEEWAGVDVAWRFAGGVCQVVEVDVSLHVTLRKQFDSDSLFINFLVQHKFLLVVVHSALTSLSGCLTRLFLNSVLFLHLFFGLVDEFILLLSFCLLDNVANTGVGIENRLKFHTF